MTNRLAAAAVLTILWSLTGPPAVMAQSVDPRDDFATAAEFGRRFFEAGNYAAALTWFEKAESLVRDQPAILFNTAVVLTKLQRYDEAQRRLERYLLLYPAGSEVQAVKALQRELQFGIEVRRREQQDTEYSTLFSRARALAEKGSRHDALDVFHQAEVINADDPALWYNEAALNEDEGDLETALRLYKKYMESSPANAPALQSRLIDVEREIGYARTKLLCPFCGAVLSAGARWCHHCWHGPFDVGSPAWNARACDSHVVVTRTVQDGAGRSRAPEQLPCAYPGTDLRDLLRYSAALQAGVRDARAKEGWTFSPEGTLDSRRSPAGVEITLQQGEYLRRIDNAVTGEVLPYRAHKTADGIWLLDSQPFSTADEMYRIDRTFDADGRVQREDVAYDSACRHSVTVSATYTYSGDTVTAAHFSGGYDGYKMEGFPQTRWEAALARTSDAAGRVTREELTVTSFQKTWNGKPQGRVSDDVRRYYTQLKVRRPTDIRASGDVCGYNGGQVIEEAVDLRPFFVIAPAVAVRLAHGDTKVVVDYTYPAK